MANDDNDDSWKTAAAPMAASILARDISCQGILALTLRDALSQIQQEQQQQQSNTGISNNSNKYADDDDLLTGTNGTTTDGPPNNKNTTGANIVIMDNIAIQNILQAMGNAVAQTQQEHWKLQQQQRQQQQHHQTLQQQQQKPEAKLDPIPTGMVQPPAALVRGRLDHYNRNNGKWRIVMDKVTFRRRMSLEPRRVRPRKSQTKSSLWQQSRQQFQPPSPSPPSNITATAAAAGTDTTTGKQEDHDKKKVTLPSMAQPSGITLQILAYNDLE